jgi:hypothetical protein
MSEWRSSALVLAAVGAAGVSGCSQQPCEEYLQNVYANEGDCRLDYANGPCLTEWAQDFTSYAVGPWYKKDRARALEGDAGPGAGDGRNVIKRHVSRRYGFGAKGETTVCSS